MPTYEYECERCGRVWEVRQRISEPALTACDQCGGPARRLLSPAPFILKGGGWYVTDYPSESRKKALAGDGDKKASPGDSKPGGDTKPAADNKPSAPAADAGPAAKDSASPPKS